MLQAVILDNGKGSRKLEIKIYRVVNNLFYFTFFGACLQNKINIIYSDNESSEKCCNDLERWLLER